MDHLISPRYGSMSGGGRLPKGTEAELGSETFLKALCPRAPQPPAANQAARPPLRGLGPAKEIGLLDVRGGVAVAAVAELVVVASLPQHHLIL